MVAKRKNSTRTGDWEKLVERLSNKPRSEGKTGEVGEGHQRAVVAGKQGQRGGVVSNLELLMPNPNSFCAVCEKPFYSSPGHVLKGWGKTCSMACRTKYKMNPRFIENDVQCKGCGKLFHVKPSAQKAQKAKSFCSQECKIKTLRANKNCPECGVLFSVPQSQTSRVKFCSMQCKKNSALSSKTNCVCQTCKKDFYTKPSELKRGINAGKFCSVFCMSRNRGKIILSDGKFASHLEVDMFSIIEELDCLEGLIREYKFHPSRKWLLDFAWPGKKIGIEIHGAIWSGKFGGHTSGLGRMRDMEKMNEAKLLGWTIIEVASNHLKDGKAHEWVKKLFR